MTVTSIALIAAVVVVVGLAMDLLVYYRSLGRSRVVRRDHTVGQDQIRAERIKDVAEAQERRRLHAVGSVTQKGRAQ